ncbi:zinc finger A20 and AN1 domain-containing stress-associated protein 5-like [Diospyros lotus]|uniref:zinc finger A20 and AN1 domain-containing stress-associated protein 5-like n=1 Tax=Diospyros lotus TaxID=55363 RepID=UPI00224F1546|nr:zinc finger A20 and AN1 domain-containing stress-associated protein 5-like [Diospyros lotus]
MAQKREKEEAELRVPDTLVCNANPVPPSSKLSGTENPPTASGSSPRSPDLTVDATSIRAASGTDDPPQRSSDPTASASASVSPPHLFPERSSDLALSSPSSPAKKLQVNRCAGCKRKVGLTGFRCRCGDLFCSDHRYSDRHDCTFDYKAAGREAIARQNPVVRPAKILKV